jgi:N-acetylmuramic acid 6-phosphate etherase
MPISDFLHLLNRADATVATAVAEQIGQIEVLVAQLAERVSLGGRLIYIGAGTSGRLGILDASECPPTFGVSPDVVMGLIAGGDGAIRKAVEFAEDDTQQAWEDLKPLQPTPKDTLVGIAASGRTPYVLGGIEQARRAGLLTAAVVCKKDTPLAQLAEIPIEVEVGEEFLVGSTRLKAGTAQKMVLNMISTALMVQLGRVKGNKMVDMQLANHKLIQRGIDFIREEHPTLTPQQARHLLLQTGSVRAALQKINDYKGIC